LAFFIVLVSGIKKKIQKTFINTYMCHVKGKGTHVSYCRLFSTQESARDSSLF